jgi:subtilisin-like proprotein convertase family protein
MASPSTTAAAALVRQYFVEGYYPSGTKTPSDAVTPSGALMRATLVNSAVDMTGVTEYPSDREGWGRVLLERVLYFDGDVRRLALLADRRNVDGFTTGQEETFSLQVSSSSEPLRITLAFTEPPAALFANPATINDLDLEVMDPNGVVYLGNVFDTSAGVSITGGSPDPRNNLEQVHLPSPPAGAWQVTVRGMAVNQDSQGFALVASGDVAPVLGPALRHDGHQIQDPPPFGNDDGILDPGETASMPVTLFNSGTEDAMSVSAFASSNLPDAVKITISSATFPDIPKGSSAGSDPPHYEFSLAPGEDCGTALRFSLAWAAGETDGFTTFPVPVGLDRGDYPAIDTPLSLPKKTNPAVVSVLSVPDAFTIGDVTVSVQITHGDVGQLTVSLASPAGTSITLHNQSRAGQADIDTTYDTVTPPDGPGTMDSFNGEGSAGDWKLTVLDETAGPVPPGQLVSWTLHLVATDPFRCSPLICGDPVPGEVGPSLTLSATSPSDILHDWAGLGGVSDYRLWRSEYPDFSSEESVTKITGATDYLEADGLAGSVSYFYQVRGLNSCNQEGP